ncbi:MAG: serine hydrolase domain-containing protein [Armatimonadota bacterium]
MKLLVVKPEELGFDKKRLQMADDIIRRGLDDGLYPGAVYLIGGEAGILEPQCFGYTRPSDGQPVQPDTVFDIASLTKPVATAASLLILIEQGIVEFEQLLSNYLPNSNLTHLSKANIFHLLTHTSGLPAWKDFYTAGQSPNDVIEGILSTHLDNPPGEVYTYSCLGYILLGEIVRITSGMRLDEFAERNIFGPLGMRDTVFNPSGELISRTAATANCPMRDGLLAGKVHDGNAWAMGGVSGNAGLFSTALDLARFAVILLSGGCGVLPEAGVRLMFRNLLDPSIGGHTAGWFIYPNAMLPDGNLQSSGTIGHTGFTGVSMAIDDTCDIFVILLTNRVCRADDGMEFRITRRLFHTTAAQAMLR